MSVTPPTPPPTPSPSPPALQEDPPGVVPAFATLLQRSLLAAAATRAWVDEARGYALVKKVGLGGGNAEEQGGEGGREGGRAHAYTGSPVRRRLRLTAYARTSLPQVRVPVCLPPLLTVNVAVGDSSEAAWWLPAKGPGEQDMEGGELGLELGLG